MRPIHRLHTRQRQFERDVERGAKEILDIFDQIGFDEELYRWRGHTRIKQIKHLLTTGQIDDEFYWRR